MFRYAALISLAIASSLAQAQDNRATALEELIVTAQHREEAAASTPISLFTLDTEQLEKQRISNIANLSGLVPNLNIDSFPANNQTLRLFIRGVGLTDTQITQDAAVGVYLNGAYIARSTGLAFDVADLQRIEVLRGPQGTLYGRNTTGGAIKLITAPPQTDAVSFKQTLSAGNQKLFTSKSSVNLPLSDKVATKLAYFYEDVNGFTDNNAKGHNFGDRKSRGWRIDLSAEPYENLNVDYAYDSSDIESYNYTAQAISPRDSGSDLLSIIGDIATQYIDYSTQRLSSLTSSSPLQPTNTEIDGHTLNIKWRLSETTSLTSISAYRGLDDKSAIDFSSGAAPGFRINYKGAVIGENAGNQRLDIPDVRPHLEHEQYSQELQLLGTINESLDYLVGLYYFYEEAREDAPLHHIFSAAPFAGGTVYNIGSELNEIENDALALFSQFTWTPSIFERRLHLTAGWRLSKDSRKAQRQVMDAVVVDQNTSVLELIPPTLFDVDTEKDFDDHSFTLIAEFDWTDNYSAYAKLSEAYKSGGFNIRDPEETPFSNGFDEEKLRSVELGFKGDLFNRMLRINAAVFHQRFDDFQYNLQIPGTIQGTRVFNVDEGEMTGVEIDVLAIPAPGLFLQLSYAYLDSELDDIINPFNEKLQSFEFTNAPQHTYSLVADYTFGNIPIGELSFTTSYNFIDDRQRTSATVFREDYALWNARLSLTAINALGGAWSVAAWGKNLQDTDYEAFTLDNLPQTGRAVIWGESRTFGVDISYVYQ